MADLRTVDARLRRTLATGAVVLGFVTVSVASTPAVYAQSGVAGHVVLSGVPVILGDDVSGSRRNNHFMAEAEVDMPGVTEGGTTDGASDESDAWDYRRVRQSCSNSGGNFCVAYACSDPDKVGYLAQRRLESRPEGDWQTYTEYCAAPDGPVVTPGLVLEAVRRIGLPSMSVEVPTETLVNYDTVVYTEAETFSRTVNLLGFTVDIEATPSEFHWTYDDGITETTTTAGRPYPATDITHTWDDAHHTFHPSVDVTYQIRFRVDGGDWQTLTDTITVSGPASDVRIREATGVLADMN
jgi:hypothetical protein